MEDELFAFLEPQLLETISQSFECLIVRTSPLVNDPHPIDTVLLRPDGERLREEHRTRAFEERAAVYHWIT